MIVFTNQPTNPPYNAYNNSILEFGVDAGTPDFANITAGGHTFKIYPDVNGNFYFNLKSIITSVINQDHFADGIIPSGAYLYPDAKLFNELAVNIVVTLDDETTVTSDTTYPFLKSVEQLIRKKYVEPELKLLSPGATDVAYLSYFEGYPFDVSVYSDIARSVTVVNQRTAMSVVLSLTKGVNRVFISNGENDSFGFENDLPLSLGVNELEFKIGAALKFTLFLDKKESECGHLVKWFNPSGGWSYFRFMDLHLENIKAGTIERLNIDYKNLVNTNNNLSITGKESERSKNLISGMVTEQERDLLDTLVSSPEVQLYINELHQPMEATDFIGVEVDNGTFTRGNKTKMSNFPVTIILPNTYTQTL